MMIPIVNEQDEIIGHKERADILPNDIYRATSLWITNSKGDILLAQRSLHKKTSPGRWGPAVAGTVEEGEEYENNIIKEAQEEIGITGLSFKLGPKIRIHGPGEYFDQWFTGCIDWDVEKFRIDKNEVGQLKWLTEKDLRTEFKNNPEILVPSTAQTLGYFLQ
jgi:isopentenyldiphosphate isomerase